MAGGKKLHTLLWIPASGLFYDNGNFWDGDGQQVEYGRILPIWETYGAAEAAKAPILARFPKAKGNFVILALSPQTQKARKALGMEANDGSTEDFS